jgi:hypothetical protein
MDVYKASAFEDRVNYAAWVISKGAAVYNARHFDTCFEMNDGDYVSAALVRRALENPTTKLAQNLFKFIGQDGALANYEKTKHLTRRELAQEAIRISVENARRIGYSNI